MATVVVYRLSNVVVVWTSGKVREESGGERVDWAGVDGVELEGQRGSLRFDKMEGSGEKETGGEQVGQWAWVGRFSFAKTL